MYGWYVAGPVRVQLMSLPAARYGQLPPVLAFGELIKVFGVSKTRTIHLVRQAAFPEPIAVLGVGKIWSTPDVVAYCERTGRKISWTGSPPEAGGS